MIAAAITIDITPPIGIPIAGNIREDNISRGVHDPILCNVGYVSQAIYNKFPQKVVIHFTNGANGDVNHLNYNDIHQVDWFPEAERIGTERGNLIL